MSASTRTHPWSFSPQRERRCHEAHAPGATDGSREATRLTGSSDPNRFLFPRIWLRDGSGLVFHAIKTSDDIGLWRKSSGAEEMLLATSIAELEPSLSPDERFMAFVSDESGRREGTFARSAARLTAFRFRATAATSRCGLTKGVSSFIDGAPK